MNPVGSLKSGSDGESDDSIRILGLRESVYTRIACLALAEKNLGYELQETDVFADTGIPKDYQVINPFGNIPSLLHAGFTLYETTAICRYIDETFDGPALQPADPRSRGVMNQIISLLDSYAYRRMVWDVYVQRIVLPQEGEQSDEQLISTALTGIRTVLQELERLRGKQQFLCGESISLADLHCYPMLHYFIETPEGRDMLRDFSSLQGWIAILRSRPAVIAACNRG